MGAGGVSLMSRHGSGRDAARGCCKQFDLSLLSDVGNDRPGNEDACGHFIENPESAIFVVADGVGGYEGGEVASAMAVESTIASYRETRQHGARPSGSIARSSAPISIFTTVR